MEKEKKTSVFIKSLLVFGVLIIAPLVSIYFLDSGRDYRRESMAELQDLGKVKSFQIVNQNNLTITPEVMRTRVAVVNFLSENATTARQQADRIAKVHESFDDTEDVLFLSFIPADSTDNMLERAKGLGITDHKQWFLLGTNDEQWNSLSSDIFQISDPTNGIALVDTSLTIRKHYDINSNPEMGRLVEHISIVIPKQKRRGL